MTLDVSINDREKAKFRDINNETVVAVTGFFGVTDIVHNKSSTYSAFGSLKVATETILGDYRFDAETFEELYDLDVAGLGRYSIEEGGTGARITVGSSTNSLCEITSKETHYYQSGRGLMVKQSIITGDIGIAGNIREWGLICSGRLNGAWLRLDGTTLSWVIARNGVETVINSSAWDTPVVHDGNGHIWYIQMEWLGTGNLYLFYDEALVHTYAFIGTSVEFSIGTPDLKLYYLNENTTNSTDVYLKFGCASVISEGGGTAYRLDQQPNDNSLAVLEKSVISGKNPDDIYENVKASGENELLVYARIQEKQLSRLIEAIEYQGVLLEKMNMQLYALIGITGD